MISSETQRRNLNQNMDGQILQPSLINRPSIVNEIEPEKFGTTRTTESILGLLSGLGNK